MEKPTLNQEQKDYVINRWFELIGEAKGYKRYVMNKCNLDMGDITHILLIPKGMPEGLVRDVLHRGRVKVKTRRGAYVLYYMNKRGTQVKKRYVYDTAE
jgi:hypothetical protein